VTTKSGFSRKRSNYPSGSKWENIVGYSRAVRMGNTVVVAGTTAVDADGQVHGEKDAYLQTRYIFLKISKVLAEAGASLKDVVRTRMYVKNIEDWKAIGTAHAEFFENIKPAATMVEVNNLISPELLVEIEVDAIVSEK
jgi:enamine deaminase RidA (YjgF/YER057c/UK114 family)